MTSKPVVLAALALAAGIAHAERNGAEWVAFETSTGVRAGDGSSVYVAFLPTSQCRPRVSVAVDLTPPAARGPDDDPVESWVTLRIDGHLPWRTDRASIYEAGGVTRAAIDDVHPDLIAELSVGERLDLGHTTASLNGAGEALKAARHACRMVLEDARPLSGVAAPRVALTPSGGFD